MWSQFFTYGMFILIVKLIEEILHSLQSQEILNRPVFVLKIQKSLNILNIDWEFWTDSEHSEHWMNKGNNKITELRTILQRVESEQILNILNIAWKVWTDHKHYEQCLNRFGTLCEKYEQILNILNIVWKVWTFSSCLNRV